MTNELAAALDGAESDGTRGCAPSLREQDSREEGGGAGYVQRPTGPDSGRPISCWILVLFGCTGRSQCSLRCWQRPAAWRRVVELVGKPSHALLLGIMVMKRSLHVWSTSRKSCSTRRDFAGPRCTFSCSCTCSRSVIVGCGKAGEPAVGWVRSQEFPLRLLPHNLRKDVVTPATLFVVFRVLVL